MPRKRRAPLASFSPRLFEVWRMALTKTVRIPVGSQKEGTRLRFRLYELRSAMKDDNHPDYASASRVSISVVVDKNEDEKGKYFVVAEHADAELDDVLDAAGVPNPAGQAPALEEIYTIGENERRPIKVIKEEP